MLYRNRPTPGTTHRALPPDALEHWELAAAELAGRRVALFLDYDGTLSRIAPAPELAVITPSMRALVERVAAAPPTTIIIGRAREDVRERVGVAAATYAGSHGFDIAGPADSAPRLEVGREMEPEIRAVADELR